MSGASEREDLIPDQPDAGDQAAGGKRGPVTTTIQAPLTQPQAHPAAEALFPRPSAESSYRDRLRGIWEATHDGASPPAAGDETAAAWQLVQKAVERVGIPALIGAAIGEYYQQQAASSAPGAEEAGLSGDIGTVEFVVSSAVRQMPPDQVPAFIAGPLARTIDRLEREAGRNPQVNRERIVDIVLRALEPLRGSARAGRIVGPLLGYLNGDQREPQVGIYMTVAVLAQLMIGLNDPRGRLARIFLYHYALTGVWRLVQGQDADFDTSVRQVVSVSAGNAGMNLWQLLPQRAEGTDGPDEVRTLRTILVTTVRGLDVSEDRAAAILQALGMPRPDARAALTVIEEVGALGGPWSSDMIDLSRIESASAVAAAALASESDSGSQVAARLYNASVSLQRAARPQAPGPLQARMLMCGLGLRWSLLLGADLIDGLGRLEGLDCATGFLRALGQYQDERHEQLGTWAPVIALAAQLSELPVRLVRDQPDLAAGAARLADAAGRVRLGGATAPAGAGLADLAAITAQAIDTLRSSGASPEADDLDSHILDTAAVLRGAFEEILGQRAWGLAGLIDQLVDLRGSAREEFVRLYQPFTEPPGSLLGTGPAVSAGVVTQEEWNDLESEFLRDPHSIVSLLQDFARQP